jgi:pimeloyl-ACP methyl ester carboxylesterase
MLVLAACVTSVLGAGISSAVGVASLRSDFYQPPQPLPHAAPGTIITKQAMSAPTGSHAWRVLYHSRSVSGRDIAVSGVVVVPDGPAPSGGRTVVTWAHGTYGIADRCAPSKSAQVTAAGIPDVEALARAGYVVVGTDYEGLGTPGVHPFLVGQSEGRGVLDAARVAHRLRVASDQVLIFGHSQGGQAALFAGELAASYAPELHVLGVVASAPAANVEQILPLASKVPAAAGVVVMGIEGFHAAYPELDPASVLSPDALRLAPIVEHACAQQVSDTYARSSTPVLAHDPLADPVFQRRFHENSAGNRPTAAPMLVIQGSADLTIPQVLTDAFVAKARLLGDTIDYRIYPGATHTTIKEALPDVLTWFDQHTQPKAGSTTP